MAVGTRKAEVRIRTADRVRSNQPFIPSNCRAMKCSVPLSERSGRPFGLSPRTPHLQAIPDGCDQVTPQPGLCGDKHKMSGNANKATVSGPVGLCSGITDCGCR